MTLVTTPDFTPQVLNATQKICHDELVDILNAHTDWIQEMSYHDCRTITGSTTLNEFDRYIVYRGGGDATITLPPIASVDPKQNIRIVNQTNNTVNVRGSGGETLNFPYDNGAANNPRPVLEFLNDTVDLFPITGSNWTEIPVFQNNQIAYARVDLGAAVTLASANSPQDIVFDNIISAPLGGTVFNTGTGEYIVPTHGHYAINFALAANPITDQDIFALNINKNGGLIARSGTTRPATAGVYRDHVSTTYFFSKGDTISFSVSMGGGSGGPVDTTFSTTYADISLMNRR